MRVVGLLRVRWSAASNAFQNEKSLIRCTAHSEWISDPGTPHTFSVYEAKNASYSRVPKFTVTKSSKVSISCRIGVSLAARVRERRNARLDEAEPRHDVPGLQRIREVLAVVVDARETRPDQELLAEDLLPQPLHRRDLREEAVAAEVEAIAVVLDGLRDAADDAVRLEHGAGRAAQAQHVGGREPRGPGSEHCRAHGSSVACHGGRVYLRLRLRFARSVRLRRGDDEDLAIVEVDEPLQTHVERTSR